MRRNSNQDFHLRVILINITFLFVGILFVEAFFGFWWPGKGQLQKINVLTNVERQFDICAYYPRTPCQINYTRDQNGLRGTYSALSEIDILTVGGSTTDQLYIDNQETWDQVLQSQLRNKSLDLTVANGGVEGQSSVGHIANFQWWYPHLPDLKPRWMIYYIGINDLYVTTSGERKHDRMVDESGVTWFTNRSVLVYFFRRLKGAYLARQTKAVHQVAKEESFEFNSSLTEDDYQRFLETKKEGYKQRVLKLVELTRARGAEPIFVTQPRRIYQIDGKLASPKGGFKIRGKYFSYFDLYHMQKILNKSLVEACRESHLTCFDLAGEVAFDSKDFYDDAHNTVSGAKKVGEYLAQKLAPLLQQK